MRKSNSRLATVLLVAAVCGCELQAKDKPSNAGSPKQDEIEIQSHVAVVAGPITRFIATRHYDRTYVYAVRAAGKPVTLLDLTDAKHPRVLLETSLPTPASNLLAVAGTAALTGDASVATAQTMTLMDFSDPAQPKVTKQFAGVTAFESFTGGLTLLANSEGIWVLKEHFAEDPAAEERYAKKIVYGESMY
jgi:uncharacterized secreted protein with C-terminal beta-propeller domain